jgi:mannose-1-phosphate guanylyltransferase
MRAMVLCAGLGTRLRPLTEHWPKPALPLLGRPLVEYTFALLRGAGVREVGINTHHLPETMAQVAGESCARLGLSLTVANEPVIQGTGGGIRGLRAFLSGGTSVVFNGDVLFALDLPRVLEAHRASGALASMVLLPMPANETYAAVELNAAGDVRRIAGRGPGASRLTPWHFTGVHILEPGLFDFMKEEGPEDINREVYLRALEAGQRVHGIVVEGYWSDLGTPSRYLATVRDLLFQQVPAAPFGDRWPLTAQAKGAGNFWSESGASAEKVAGPAYFDRGCEISPTARIGASVAVGRNARIPAGVRLNRSVVFDDTALKEGEVLLETLAWREHRIPAPL